MRNRVLSFVAAVLPACGGSPSQVTTPGPRSVAPEATAAKGQMDKIAQPAPSLLSYAAPPAMDGSLPAPKGAELNAVTDREAWITFANDTTYDAIIDRATGCVTQTIVWPTAEKLFAVLPDSPDEAAYIALFLSDEFKKAMATRLAMLARFPEMTIESSSRDASREATGHSDGTFAISEDHRQIALLVHDRLYMSTDGGVTFRRASNAKWSGLRALRYVANDRFLAFLVDDDRASVPQLILVDPARDGDPVIHDVTTTDYEATQIATPDGKLLFLKQDERCIYALDTTVANPALTKLWCAPTYARAAKKRWDPPISASGIFVAQPNNESAKAAMSIYRLDGSVPPHLVPGMYNTEWATVGPDDEGRYAWEENKKVHTITATGISVVPIDDAYLGFDAHGTTLLFHAPEIADAGTATLDDVRCSLLKSAPLR